MTKLNDIESKLTKLVTDNQNEINDYEVKIRNADKAIQDANSTLRDAETNVNVDGYNKAKNNIWSAKHAKELYEKAKNKAESEPSISRVEYKSLLAEIKDVIDKKHADENERASKLIGEIRKIAKESLETDNEANKLLHTVQYDIYKDADVMVLGNGKKVSFPEEYKSRITVNQFYLYKVKGTPLSKLAGE